VRSSWTRKWKPGDIRETRTGSPGQAPHPSRCSKGGYHRLRDYGGRIDLRDLKLKMLKLKTSHGASVRDLVRLLSSLRGPGRRDLETRPQETFEHCFPACEDVVEGPSTGRSRSHQRRRPSDYVRFWLGPATQKIG
jgi:hypothetical protein